MTNENESYSSGKQKKRWREKEQREKLQRGIDDMLGLLEQSVWLLVVIAIMLLAVIVGGVALLLVS